MVGHNHNRSHRMSQGSSKRLLHAMSRRRHNETHAADKPGVDGGEEGGESGVLTEQGSAA